MRGQRRLGAHQAALAFEALEQRGLLAADIGAGADADLEVEGVGRAGDARPSSRSRRAAVMAAFMAAMAWGYSERM